MTCLSLPIYTFNRASISTSHRLFTIRSSLCSLLPSPSIDTTHAQDREAVEVANLEERKLVLKFEADELDRTRDELVRSLEEKRKSQVWLAGSEMHSIDIMGHSTRAHELLKNI